MLKHSLRALSLCLLAWHAGSSPAGAQAYPTKTIQIVAGFPPGGSVDLVARTAAHGLSVELGQTVLGEAGDYKGMFAGVLTISLIGFACDRLYVLAMNRILVWRG